MKRVIVRQALLLLALAFVPAIVQALYLRDQVSWAAPALGKDEVEVPQAQSWGEAVLWLDARPDAQFAEAHIPNALLLNEDRWNELLPAVLAVWTPEKRIVVYCSTQACAASHGVAHRLRKEAGLSNVFVLHGGWEAWLKANP